MSKNNKIKPSKLYTILKNDDLDQFMTFLSENPDFDLHNRVSVGRHDPILIHSIHNKSYKCSSFIMNIMNFTELFDRYLHSILRYYNDSFNTFIVCWDKYFNETNDIIRLKDLIHSLINCAGSNDNDINHFITYCNYYIAETNDLEFIQSIIFDFIIRSKSDEVLNDFINTNSDNFKKLILENDIFRYKFENLMIQSKFQSTCLLCDLYIKFDFDLSFLFAKIMLRCNEQTVKKLNKYFKNIDYNNKVFINNFCDVKFSYFNNHQLNYWKSKYQYSLSFIHILRGLDNKKIKNTWDLFKNNNFETEFFNFLEDDLNYRKSLNVHNALFGSFTSYIFYGIVYSNYCINIENNNNSIKIYNYNKNYFGELNESEFVYQQFKLLKPCLTDAFYNKILEINDASLQKSINYIENSAYYPSMYNNYHRNYITDDKQRRLNTFQTIHQSNIEFIQRLRNEP